MSGPDHAELARDMGKMEAGLEALKDVVTKGFNEMKAEIRENRKETKDSLEKVETRLLALETVESQRKGALRMVAAVAGVIGGAIGVLMELLTKWGQH